MSQIVAPLPARESGPRRLTLGVALILIAILACGIAGYRYYLRNIRTHVTAYHVDDLLPDVAPGRSRTASDFASLIASIQAQVMPSSWKARGGKGSIQEFLLNGSLIVRTSESGHEQIVAFLRQKRLELRDENQPKAAP